MFPLCQVVISSIMCSYNREDWTELAKMAEVRQTPSQVKSVTDTEYVLCVVGDVSEVKGGTRVFRSQEQMHWSSTCPVLMGWEKEEWDWPVDRYTQHEHWF